MVDWDRVETLRAQGWDWDRIAKDPSVGFHPEASVHHPGRALNALHSRRSSRQRRRGDQTHVKVLSKDEQEKRERRWTLPRLGYLLFPVFAVWFSMAYLVPSPVGLVLAAFPYLALALAIAAFLLLFGLFRSSRPRWSKLYRTTVVTGVVVGFVLSGVIALGGALVFGCPYLPSEASGTAQPAPGWISVDVAPWHSGGHPVLYSFGATWCPYCSASSWAIWKALSGFGTVTGTSLMYSAEDSIPEIVLADAHVSSSVVTLVVTEDTSGNTRSFPAATDCVEQAYVSAYSGNTIPFVVINGQYVHGGSTLVSPGPLASINDTQVAHQVMTENGTAWTLVQGSTWWMMAFIAKSAGATPGNLAHQSYYSGWSAATKSSVASDLAQIR